MLLSESFELDVKNGGNPLAAWLDAMFQSVAGSYRLIRQKFR